MKVILKPLLMVAFVFIMIYLMEEKIEEDKQLELQQHEINPDSVIYAEPDEVLSESETTTATEEKQSETLKENSH